MTSEIKCYDNYYENNNIQFVKSFKEELSELLDVIRLENSVYKNLTSRNERLLDENDKLEQESNRLKQENEELKKQVELLKENNKKLQEKITKDYVTKYSLLRKGEAFSFTPMLSKEFNKTNL